MPVAVAGAPFAVLILRVCRTKSDRVIRPAPPGDHHNMGLASLIRQAWEIVPIVLLLMVGGAIAIPSGVRHTGSRRDARQLAGNLSAIVLRVLGYVALLLILHQWIGVRPA